jgi:SpoVK/Ycf46/Vps4 family AAA+-type ATPase
MDAFTKLTHDQHELDNWSPHAELTGQLSEMLNAPQSKVVFAGEDNKSKLLAAGLLAKRSGKELYRVDLSLVLSKYIGETEKNIARVFTDSKNKNWILFFDEVDALFGKRTEVRDAHDRYANIEVNYLIQAIEEYNGIVILSTNHKTNIDDTFLRRLRFIVEFPFPSKEK